MKFKRTEATRPSYLYFQGQFDIYQFTVKLYNSAIYILKCESKLSRAEHLKEFSLKRTVIKVPADFTWPVTNEPIRALLKLYLRLTAHFKSKVLKKTPLYQRVGSYPKYLTKVVKKREKSDTKQSQLMTKDSDYMCVKVIANLIKDKTR